MGFIQDVMTRIVNVHWGGGDQQWLLGKLPPNDPAEAFSYDWWNDYYQSETRDGESHGAITSVASGLGCTVFTNGFIAFGMLTIEDEDTGEPIQVSRFMHATKAGVVNLGTFADGEIEWEEVISFDGRIVALSFAHDAFFVTYRSSDDYSFTRLAVMRDGETFTDDIDPFPDLSADGGIWNGNVAWNADAEQYATVGSGYVTAGDPSGYGSNASLFWSASSDGLSWIGGTTGSAYTGTGAQTNTSHHSSIAAGKGIFVAAAASKHRFTQVPLPDFVLHRAAVATSPDGVTWTEQELPDAVVNSDDTGSTQGDGLAVAFVKNSQEEDGDGSGYFVASGYETSSKTGVTPVSKLWTSPDGITWTLVTTEANMIYGALGAIPARVNPDNVITIIGSP